MPERIANMEVIQDTQTKTSYYSKLHGCSRIYFIAYLYDIVFLHDIVFLLNSIVLNSLHHIK